MKHLLDRIYLRCDGSVNKYLNYNVPRDKKLCHTVENQDFSYLEAVYSYFFHELSIFLQFVVEYKSKLRDILYKLGS